MGKRSFLCKFLIQIQLVAFTASVGFVPVVQADLVKLRGGGEIRGKELKSARSGAPVVITTLSGATLSLPRSEVRFVTERALSHEDYELRVNAMDPYSVEQHWELAEWCRSHRLTSQRRVHLEKIIELDADHVAAHKGLGHKLLPQGQWVDPEQEELAQGNIKYKGKYVPFQIYALLEKTAAEREREVEWGKQIRSQLLALNSPNLEKSLAATRQIQTIQDENAAPAITDTLLTNPNPEVRRLGVEALGRIGSQKSIPGLVRAVLLEDQDGIRESALMGLQSPLHERSAPLLAGYLRHPSNVVVRRAGRGLEQVGDRKVVPQLIEALITQHTVPVSVATPVVGYAVPLRSPGSPGSEPLDFGPQAGAIPFGLYAVDPSPSPGNRISNVQRPFFNPEVLAALQRITGENFGYDERAWQLWWGAIGSKHG